MLTDTCNVPKHLWYAKKYKVYPDLFIETNNWTKIASNDDDNDEEEKVVQPKKVTKSLKKTVRNVIISSRIKKSFEARAKGSVLQNCDLPDQDEKSVAEIFQWKLGKKITINDEDPEETEPNEDDINIEDVENEASSEEEKKRLMNNKSNPYLYFLEAVGDETDDDHYGTGVLGGLQSWLGFAGSLGGHEMTGLGAADPGQHRRPWLRSVSRSGEQGDQGVNKKAEEHMTRHGYIFLTKLKIY